MTRQLRAGLGFAAEIVTQDSIEWVGAVMVPGGDLFLLVQSCEKRIGGGGDRTGHGADWGPAIAARIGLEDLTARCRNRKNRSAPAYRLLTQPAFFSANMLRQNGIFDSHRRAPIFNAAPHVRRFGIPAIGRDDFSPGRAGPTKRSRDAEKFFPVRSRSSHAKNSSFTLITPTKPVRPLTKSAQRRRVQPAGRNENGAGHDRAAID